MVSLVDRGMQSNIPRSKSQARLTFIPGTQGTQYFLAGAIKSRVFDNKPYEDDDKDDVVSQGNWFGCSVRSLSISVRDKGRGELSRFGNGACLNSRALETYSWGSISYVSPC